MGILGIEERPGGRGLHALNICINNNNNHNTINKNNTISNTRESDNLN
jgi:hypothetical protein